MKYRLTFTVESETIFATLSKLLPIEDLKVQELEPGRAIHVPAPKPIPAPKPAPLKKKKRKGVSFLEGINKVIYAHLTQRPYKSIELRPALKEAGYSPNSVGSRLQALSEAGLVKKHGDGFWSLMEQSSIKDQNAA